MNYTSEILRQLLHQEETLVFEKFTSAEALALGNLLVTLGREYDRGISVRITREADQLVLFQYMEDSKTAKNIEYMEGKRKASLASGHCSAYVNVSNQLYGKYQEMFENFPEYCPSAGAFPLRVNGVLTATAAVSGLHDGKDHELIIRALEKQLGRDTGEFPWVLV